MDSPRLNKYRDSYVLYIPTVHTLSSVNFTYSILVQTHTLCIENILTPPFSLTQNGIR